MSGVALPGHDTLGDRQVYRLGYNVVQLAGPDVFGSPKDPGEVVRILQVAAEAGVNHIDTSDFYGPYVTNQLIRKTLHPYPDDLYTITKVSARRNERGNWLSVMPPAELTQAVEDDLRNLGPDMLEMVNLRSMFSPHGPAEDLLETLLTTLLELETRGLIRHIGLSNVTAKQVADAQKMTPIVCVQGLYNITHRADDALVDALVVQHIMWVSFLPLGGLTPLRVQELDEVVVSLETAPMQVVLAWLLQRSPNILPIPGTFSRTHLAENIVVAQLALPDDALCVLDNIAICVHP